MIKILGEELTLNDFSIESGAMKIGDPCYSPDTWCLGEANNVLNGKWTAKVFRADDLITDWGDRNTALFAFNRAFFEDNFNFDDIEVERFMNGAYETQFCLYVEYLELGVDSGQAGIYDAEHYIKMKEQDEETRFSERDDTWYWSNNATITLHGIEAGVTPDKKGCVSSSGYGDGSYDYYVYRDKEGQAVAVAIIFITENEDSEDEE